MAIALVDYHAGNLTSVKKALTALGAEVFVPGSPSEIEGASGIVVPGVGHFGATQALDQTWVEAIVDRIGQGRPLLGICLGMHWLFEGSEEAPELSGLGLFGGTCYRLGTRVHDGTREQGSAGAPVKVPHVGWNSLEILREASITEGIPNGAQVYFTHSFVAPLTGDETAVTAHGERFAAVVQRGQIAGVQFHPEKSGDVGLRVLRNFVELSL